MNGLAEFANWAIQQSFEGMDIDGFDVQEKAVELGLLVETKFDPKVHRDSVGCADEGDPWFLFSDEFKAALAVNAQGTAHD